MYVIAHADQNSTSTARHNNYWTFPATFSAGMATFYASIDISLHTETNISLKIITVMSVDRHKKMYHGMERYRYSDGIGYVSLFR